jgi:hypothetical protein
MHGSSRRTSRLVFALGLKSNSPRVVACVLGERNTCYTITTIFIPESHTTKLAWNNFFDFSITHYIRGSQYFLWPVLSRRCPVAYEGAYGQGEHTFAQKKRGGFVKLPGPTFLDCSLSPPNCPSLPAPGNRRRNVFRNGVHNIPLSNYFWNIYLRPADRHEEVIQGMKRGRLTHLR